MSCECEEQKCPDGLPAWVMTFADLMSLLLAFFVLLFSFSEIDKNVYKEMAGSMRDAFGVQREIKAKEPPKGINIIAREFSPGRPQETPLNEVRQHTTEDYHKNPVFTKASIEGQENQNRKTTDNDDKSYNSLQEKDYENKKSLNKLDVTDIKITRQDLERLKRVKLDGKQIRHNLSSEINNGMIELEVKERRIILRIKEKGSFLSGSANVIKPFRDITKKISRVFSDFNGSIVVAGHTDNIPIRTKRFRSNWELSSSRAVSVIHELSRNKLLRKKRFQIEAYAATRPVDTNKTGAGRSRNRRVEIILDYRDDSNSEIPKEKKAEKSKKSSKFKASKETDFFMMSKKTNK